MSANDNTTLKGRLARALEDNPAFVVVAGVLFLIGGILDKWQALKDIPPKYVLGGLVFLGVVAVSARAWSVIMPRYFEPQPNDTPLQALRKAKRSHASMDRVKLSDKFAQQLNVNDLTHYFIYRQRGNRVWIAPEIRYRWIATSDSGITEQAFSNRLNEDYDSRKPNYVGRLLESIEKAVRDKTIEVSWYQGKGNMINAVKPIGVKPICTDCSNIESLRLSLSLRPINYERLHDIEKGERPVGAHGVTE